MPMVQPVLIYAMIFALTFVNGFRALIIVNVCNCNFWATEMDTKDVGTFSRHFMRIYVEGNVLSKIFRQP